MPCTLIVYLIGSRAFGLSAMNKATVANMRQVT